MRRWCSVLPSWAKLMGAEVTRQSWKLRAVKLNGILVILLNCRQNYLTVKIVPEECISSNIFSVESKGKSIVKLMTITDGVCFLHFHFIFDPGTRLWRKSHLSLCTVLWFKSQNSPGVHDLVSFWMKMAWNLPSRRALGKFPPLRVARFMGSG